MLIDVNWNEWKVIRSFATAVWDRWSSGWPVRTVPCRGMTSSAPVLRSWPVNPCRMLTASRSPAVAMMTSSIKPNTTSLPTLSSDMLLGNYSPCCDLLTESERIDIDWCGEQVREVNRLQLVCENARRRGRFQRRSATATVRIAAARLPGGCHPAQGCRLRSS